MRTHARRFAAAVALAGAACLVVGTGSAGDRGGAPWKQFLPADAYQELVKRGARAIEEALAGKPDEEAVKRAQFNALMIAGYTLSAKGPAEGERAAVRAAALKIAKLAGQSAVRGARPVNYNQFKIPLMANLVTRAVRDATA